jgi:hypothetical protein
MARDLKVYSNRKEKHFSCPVSTHVAWNWGLVFKECPVVAGERDMEECRTCPLRGSLTDELRKEKSRPKRDHHDKNKKRSGKPSDGVTPNKGKAYVGQTDKAE